MPQQRPVTPKRLLDEGAPILVYARLDAFTCALSATSLISAPEFMVENPLLMQPRNPTVENNSIGPTPRVHMTLRLDAVHQELTVRPEEPSEK